MKIKKSKKRIIRHEQWIEISQQDGRTVTLRYPSNKEFDRLLQEMDPKPDLIYRRLNFIGGVPKAYMWTKPDENARKYGGLFLQRITPAEWPIINAAEEINPAGHALPARFPKARPEELGPCPCRKCTEERELGLPSRFK